MKAVTHPLYSCEEFVKQITGVLLENQCSVLQLFQVPGGEQKHSEWLLEMADPGHKARRVLSLGCGVAAMEGFWKAARPELIFELVNISQAQLDLALCEGRKVRADAEDYRSDQAHFDIVVLAYVLGHVDVAKTLESALVNLARMGKLLIYDVFEGSRRFDKELHYDSPSFGEIEEFMAKHDLRMRAAMQGGIPLGAFAAAWAPWITDEVTPGLFVLERRQ